MANEKFVKSLKKVKLIIGNGFDLHCGLHTKYSDFYCKNIDKFRFINTIYDAYEKTEELNFEDENVRKLSVWDLFFFLNSSKDPKANKKWWCDIERLMLSSFVSMSDKEKVTPELMASYMGSNIHWDVIKNHISKNTLATNHSDRFVVDYIRAKMSFKGLFPDDFYSLLLDELKEFEIGFGEFIYGQLHETWFEFCNHGKEFVNESYVRKAADTIKELCDENNLVAIDSFNYGDIRVESVADKLQNINGDIKSPIFGIDSIFEPKDQRFIFTKTARRIDSDLFGFSYDAKPEFENIVIFGHSLNPADYSYFFPLFDRIKLTDIFATNVIVFAYSIYDEKKEKIIKSQLRDAMSKLLYAYAVDKQLPNPCRFLDSLSTQKRIITYEIPVLRKEKYSSSLVDREWRDIYKKVESIK